MKHAFVVFAGPQEAGRVFHALTYAKQAQARGDIAEVYFASEGTYWPAQLARTDHQMHGLYKQVEQAGIVKGACRQCAVAFGNEDAGETACTLVDGPAVSYGQIDVLGLEDAGYRVWLF